MSRYSVSKGVCMRVYVRGYVLKGVCVNGCL